MTKRDFIALADDMRDVLDLAKDYADTGRVSPVVEALANFCSGQNPRFKRKLWLDYLHGLCGPSGGKR